jgi:hypothetical protein
VGFWFNYGKLANGGPDSGVKQKRQQGRNSLYLVRQIAGDRRIVKAMGTNRTEPTLPKTSLIQL